MNKRIAILAAGLVALCGVAYAQTQNLNLPGAAQQNLNTPSVFYQGTWTPIIVGSATPGTGSTVYTIQSGSYEIIGRNVTVRFNVQGAATPGAVSDSGNVEIIGLPIAAGGVALSSDVGVCDIDAFGNVTLSGGFGGLAATITPGQTIIQIVQSGTGKGIAGLPVTSLATPAFIGKCSYHAP